MDSRQLGAFLRSRRERLRPEDAGLPASLRRRTPGLRRDEVAHLAFVSTDYYTRLEQARAPQPSRDVLTGLARALRLNDSERRYLDLLAGARSAQPLRPSREVRRSTRDLLHRLSDVGAIVVSATYEVLAWNDLASVLLEDFSAVSPRDRNLARRAFLGPHPSGRRLFGVVDPDGYARTCALHLRATFPVYSGDPETIALIAELRSGSSHFERIWNDHNVTAREMVVKTFDHPLVGPITVNCDSLDVPECDQRVVIYSAEPGSPSGHAMRKLSQAKPVRQRDPDPFELGCRSAAGT